MTLERLTQITSVGITSGITLNNATLTGVTTITNLDSVSVGGTITAVNGTFSGNVSITGTLTYEDVTNIDSVGLITARSGIHVTSGSLGIGTDNAASKLTVYGTNQEDVIYISTGNNAGDTFANIRGDNESGIRIRGGGSYDGGTIELSGGLRDTDPGIIKFSTGTGNSVDERLRISSSGNVGIGSDIPSNALDVNGTIKVYANTNIATFKNNQLRSDAAGTYYFDHGTTGQSFTFRTSTSSSLDTTGPSVTSAGNISFPSGKGIDFSATSDATGMTSELLDDYEEGTWTPTSETGTIDYTSAKYTKIGNIVHLNVYINNWSNITSDAVVQIQSLPYAGEDTDANVGSVMYRYINDTDSIGGDMVAYMANGNSLRFYFQNSVGDSNYAALKHKDINGDTSSFRVQMTYRAA
jgi:hypothetical protein